MRYLTAPLNIRGCSDGVLSLASCGKKHHCLFSINSCLTKPFYRLRDSDNINVNPEIWFEGDESFLIRCTRRYARIDGFIAVQRKKNGSSTSIQEEFKIVARPNEREHDSYNCHMTFQLHPKRKWRKPDLISSQTSQESTTSEASLSSMNILSE